MTAKDGNAISKYFSSQSIHLERNFLYKQNKENLDTCFLFEMFSFEENMTSIN